MQPTRSKQIYCVVFFVFTLSACGEASKTFIPSSPSGASDSITGNSGSSASSSMGSSGIGGMPPSGSGGFIQGGSSIGGQGGFAGNAGMPQNGTGGSAGSQEPIPSCTNNIKDGSETDVDCGGSCSGCEPSASCLVDSDCNRSICEDNICGCIPLETCPTDSCGMIDDGCGAQIDCTSCPEDDQVCYQSSCCTRLTCEDADDDCGSFDDGCGQQLDCGCDDPEVCHEGNCCMPLTECPDNSCGEIDNGCGENLDCGDCADANWCGGGGVPNECGCTGPVEVCECEGEDCCVIGDNPEDTDDDGVIDCLDACPDDENRTLVAVCCGEPMEPDSDEDGIPDCDEDGDSSEWTDKDIFNGVHVELREQCDSTPECDEYDTIGEVQACANEPGIESLDQYAGWNWDNSIGLRDNPADEDYGFMPNWEGASSVYSWQILAQGYIYFAQDGTYCFAIEGSNDEACASLYFVETPAEEFTGWDDLARDTSATVQHGTVARCFTLSSGVYPILWHYDRDYGSNSDFNLLYCYGSDAECTPTAILPSSMLRLNP